MQYFAFRSLLDEAPQTVEYVIENAGDASYTDAWKGSTVFTSKSLNDPNAWTRLPTDYTEDGKLVWQHKLDKAGTNYYSYFPPYTHTRHMDLLDRCSASDAATVFSLGSTLDGREMDCVRVGTGDKVCWIIHRQHPGETMAEYYAEGVLTRLLGLDTNGSVDGIATKARSLYTFYIVPNMCPDGAFRG